MKREDLINVLLAKGIKLDKYNSFKSKSGKYRVKLQKMTVKLFTLYHDTIQNKKEWLSLGSVYYGKINNLALQGNNQLGNFESYTGIKRVINLDKF